MRPPNPSLARFLPALWMALAFAVIPPAPVHAEADATAHVSRPDVPGEVVVAPTPRQRERRAMRQLLAERSVELAALQARVATAPENEQAELQVEIEQHKRATRLALLDRQLTYAQSRGDIALARRLEMQRTRAAAFVVAPLREEVAR